MRNALTLALVAVTSIAHAKGGAMDKNIAVVKRFEEEFKNRGHHEVIFETHAADCVIHFPDPRVTTREQVKALGDQIAAAFPDVHVEVADSFAVDDKVVIRNVVKATHKGTFNGVPASNRPVTWTEMHIYRVAGGKIVEQWSEINLLGLLTQIGALPPPPK